MKKKREDIDPKLLLRMAKEFKQNAFWQQVFLPELDEYIKHNSTLGWMEAKSMEEIEQLKFQNNYCATISNFPDEVIEQCEAEIQEAKNQEQYQRRYPGGELEKTE